MMPLLQKLGKWAVFKRYNNQNKRMLSQDLQNVTTKTKGGMLDWLNSSQTEGEGSPDIHQHVICFRGDLG